MNNQRNSNQSQRCCNVHLLVRTNSLGMILWRYDNVATLKGEGKKMAPKPRHCGNNNNDHSKTKQNKHNKRGGRKGFKR